MSFDPAKLTWAFGAPPASIKIYKRAMLYVTADAMAVVCAPGYMNGAQLSARDMVTISSTHQTDGASQAPKMVKILEGGAIQLVNEAPPGFDEG